MVTVVFRLRDLVAAADRLAELERAAAEKAAADDAAAIAEAKASGRPLHPDYWRRRHNHQSKAMAAGRMANALREIEEGK